MIHLSNRPSTSNAAPSKKPEVNPKSTKDFPSLGRKSFNLDTDFVPLVPVNHNSVSAKHRSIVNQTYESAATAAQTKVISKMSIHGSYHALPYYQHCKFVLKDKFDVIFPELLVLMPDISKQQELYLVHSQQQASSVENKKPTKKNQNVGLEVCATCKQVLIPSDLSIHLQSHSLENNFPKLGNQDDDNAVSNARAWKK